MVGVHCVTKLGLQLCLQHCSGRLLTLAPVEHASQGFSPLDTDNACSGDVLVRNFRHGHMALQDIPSAAADSRRRACLAATSHRAAASPV